jgi:heat-inducible transcriptional repressor
MADLEEMGYLDHPYTSAGRVPTRLGYRTFVDHLMNTPSLPKAERRALKQHLARLVRSTDQMLKESTHLLSKLTSLLGLALSPSLSTGVLERLDIVQLSGPRLMFVLSIRSGLVKTLVLEFEADLDRRDIDGVVSILNERLSGLTLQEIRETHEERVQDVHDQTGLIDRVMDEATLIFSEPREGRLQLGGTRNLLTQPEFQEPDDVRRLIGMIEDTERVVALLEEANASNPDPSAGTVSVRIGSENEGEEMASYSVVTSPYRVGDTVGTLGVIGPTRMDYAHVVAIVENMAALLNRPPVNDG